MTLRILFGLDIDTIEHCASVIEAAFNMFKDNLMADVNAAIDDLKATVAAEAEQFKAVAQANADALAALQAQIAELQAQIASGVNAEAIVAALAEVKLGVQAIVPDAPAA